MKMRELLAMMPDTSRSALYGDPRFVSFRKAIRKGSPPPKGYKTADGIIEAKDEDEDEDEEE
jgi:hypothetical protein